MNSSNYINIDIPDSSKYIYRIVSVKRLFELFETHQNILVSPGKWDDPFENFILNSKAKLPDGKLMTFDIRISVYGQCWTKCSSSDAMWRIYSPKSDGVRIRTTIQKLAKSLSSSVGNNFRPRCFIGKVRYLNEMKLREFANSVFLDLDGKKFRVFAETLLVKRPSFRHEREVRLIYVDCQSQVSDEIYNYYVDPHKLIDQIMIDPRVEYKVFEDIKNKIKEQTGFGGKILKSMIYAPPKEMVIPFGKA